MIRAALAVAVALWATAAVPQTQDQPERASISLDQARVLARQALHAAQLSFEHPISGESLVFEAPRPADFEALAQALAAALAAADSSD